MNFDSACEFSLASSQTVGGWGRYVQAVLAQLVEADCPVVGFDAVIHGTVPIGSGLSSSASLEAAVATLAEQLGGFTLGKLKKAMLCQRAENVGVGVNCGILDQYSSILGELGKAIVLDCRALTHETAAISDELQPVICNTRAPRQLSGSEYGDRRGQCETGAAHFASLDSNIRTLRDVPHALFDAHRNELDDDIRKRSQFIIEEHARVAELACALENDNRPLIGTIMSKSFKGARDLFEISVREMECMYDSMQSAPGVVGCRQAGAGFGGCMVSLVQQDIVAEFVAAVKTEYERATGIEPQIYPVSSALGAGKIL